MAEDKTKVKDGVFYTTDNGVCTDKGIVDLPLQNEDAVDKVLQNLGIINEVIATPIVTT